MRRIFSLALTVFLCASCLLGMAPVGHTVGFVLDIPGYDGEVDLYLVGSVDGTFLDAYEDSGIDLDTSDEDVHRTLPSVLRDFIDSNGIEPDMSQPISSGRASFSNVQDGLYLVTGSDFSTEDSSYFVSPALIKVDGDADFELKHTAVLLEKKVDVSVRKEWEGPKLGSVKVNLLQNGKPYESFTLSEDCAWEHTWPGLSGSYRWSVAEDGIPADYVCSVETDDGLTILTNKFVGTSSPEPSPTPAGPGEPEPSDPPADKSATNPDTGVGPMASAAIPVVLCSAGLALLVFLAANRMGKHE